MRLTERGMEPEEIQHSHHLERTTYGGTWPDDVIDLAHLPGGPTLRKAFRHRCGFDTGHRHAVGHNMVRVTVATVGIVGDNNIRTVLTDNVYQLAYNVFV